MGSSSSRNAVASSPPERKESHRRFRSGCFRSSSNSHQTPLNSTSHEEACDCPIAAGSKQEVGEDSDPVSHASTSSTQVCSAQAFEPSSSFASRSSSRGESNSAANCCSNGSTCNKHHSNSRLRRTTSLGSSKAYSLFARRFRCHSSTIEQNTVIGEGHLQSNRPCNLCESQPRQQNSSSLQTRLQEYADHPSDALEWGDAFSESSRVAQAGNRSSQQDMTFNINQATVSDENTFSMVHPSTVAESRDPRRIHRRGTPEHVESNVNFRRTRSVGRLRDRVLRRTASSDDSFSILQEDSMDRESRRHNGRRFWEALTRASSNRYAGTPPTVAQDQFLHTLRSISSSRRQWEEGIQMNDRTSTLNNNILENRRLYLEERRRRARSQVRALQHLSRSFENFAGHERSCILAGHHRTARCSCQNLGRTEDSNTRASISRIIILAEALFEVLDEIHHQSMALSSRSSVSSLGSFPAPDDVVDSLPVRLYSKKGKNLNEDSAQCYICLVEYEEGDHVRVLPCHHEFHQLCVDKWLKEVHRVCPLCRGNVCDSSLINNAGDS